MLAGLMSRWTRPFLWAKCNGLGDFGRPQGRLVARDAAGLDPLSQVFARDQLVNDIAAAVLGQSRIEHCHDAGMPQTGDAAGFVQVLVAAFFVLAPSSCRSLMATWRRNCSSRH